MKGYDDIMFVRLRIILCALIYTNRRSPLCGVVLSGLCGAKMVSDRAEVTVVPLVLAGSVRHVHSCQSRRP
jgi:hypothetical protein